ncbi:MAG: hypothetical protein U9O86_05590 [Campylobacterota bacterium]|nr:hypothetical protein [Campylobacterota bacterium]
MKSFFTSITLLLVLLSGCSTQPEPSSMGDRPSWILNPHKNGNRGAVGIAGRTYDQRVSTQRKLAITRALDELTLQRGVKVNLNMDKRELVTDDRSSTSLDTQSSYNASSSVSAHIESVYKDNYTGEIFIWMVMD